MLVPDIIAFQLGEFSPIRNHDHHPSLQVDILFLLWTDKEAIDRLLDVGTRHVKKKCQEEIANLLSRASSSGGKDLDLTFRVVDWNDRLNFYLTRIFTISLTSAVELLSVVGKVVLVCDRLHAAVLYCTRLVLVGTSRLSISIKATSGKLTKKTLGVVRHFPE
jgi:hypothetical protein